MVNIIPQRASFDIVSMPALAFVKPPLYLNATSKTKTRWSGCILNLLVLVCHCLTHLWLDDSKQVPPNDKLLGKAVVLFGLEGNAKEAHDAGVAGKV